jgi:hypothetical protein
MELFNDVTLLISVLDPLDVVTSNHNKGHISFSNMAVWLILYEMLNDTEKERCLRQISLANSDKNIKEIINFATNHIRQLIKNYKNGITINTNQKTVISNLNFSFLDWLLEHKFLNINNHSNNEKYFSIEMEQKLQFQWRKLGTPLDIFSDYYLNQKHEFLEFKKLEYESFVLNYKNIKWLVISKPVYLNTHDNGRLLFFTPMFSNYNWENIIPSELYCVFNKQTNIESLKDYKNILLENKMLQEIYVSHLCENGDINSCLIPNLKNKYVGTKISTTKLTIFSPLLETNTINGILFKNIKLDCSFLIKYDERGGEIENKVRVTCTDGGPPRSKKAFRIIINKPFILCYQSSSDVYCFTIQTVSNNLISHVTPPGLVF